MTKYVDEDGVTLSKTQVTALTAQTTPDRVFTGTVYQKFTHEGANFESANRVAFVPGQRFTQAQFDALFAGAATVTLVAPSTGLLAAGGEVVTITGTNLSGVTSVTFGATAGTALQLVSDTEIKVTTPAKTAGVHAVVVVDDVTGNVAAGNVTYV